MNKELLFKLYKDNPFNQRMGAELLEVEKSFAKGQIVMEKHHENIYGGMHGGCLYALADSVSGIAAATCGHFVTTLNGNMNYLRPATKTETVICEAKVLREGRTISVVDYLLKGDDDTVFATGTFNYYILEGKETDHE